jgi:biopolymer transport protein ExbD
MHGTRASEDEPMADMNFIPLIDIALTLVIILMVTTAFIRLPGVNLKLPETKTREGSPEQAKDTTILVTRDGALYLNAEKKSLPEIQAHLLTVAAKDKQSRVLVKGDREAVYGRVMEVMDIIRQAGLTRIVLPTDPKLPSQPAQTQSPPAVVNPAPAHAALAGGSSR